jgi:hypothetical protein
LREKEEKEMHTLFDFITYVKGVEYIIAVLSIGVFILFWEALKPRPFRSMVSTAKDDLGYIRQRGYRETMKTMGKIAAAPFIGIAYVALLPFAFFFAVSYTAVGGIVNMAGKSAAFEWKPLEAYLAGRRKVKKESEPKKGEDK